MRWRIGSLLHESVLNLGARNVMPVVFLAVGLLGLVVVELLYSSEMLALREQLVDTGRYVVTVETEQPALSSSRCSELETLSGVIAAGSDMTLTEGNQAMLVAASSAPRTEFIVTHATTGALRVWDPRLTLAGSQGMVVGETAAAELGLRSGMWTRFSNDWHARVLAIPASVRINEVSRRIIALTPPVGSASRCWVEFTPATFAAGQELLTAWFPAERPTFVRPLHRESEFARDPEREFLARPQKLAWVGVGVVGVLFLWYVSWARRGEIALYAALSLSASGRLLMTQTEVLFQVALAWTAAMLWGLAVHVAVIGWPSHDQVALAARTSGSASLLIVLLAPLGAFVVRRTNIAQVLKDR